MFDLWKTFTGQGGKKVARFFLIMICVLCFLCLVHLAEDILQKTAKHFFCRNLNTVYAFADLRVLSPLNFVEHSFEIVSIQVVCFFLEELLVNRNNGLIKWKIRKLFASQEYR